MECRGFSFLIGIVVGGFMFGESPRADVARHIAAPVTQQAQTVTQDQLVGFVPHLIATRDDMAPQCLDQ